jgi:hypothetical protein
MTLNLNALWTRVYEKAIDDGLDEDEALALADESLWDYADYENDRRRDEGL